MRLPPVANNFCMRPTNLVFMLNILLEIDLFSVYPPGIETVVSAVTFHIYRRDKDEVPGI